MKCFLIIALLCASFVSFSQIDTRFVKQCGFTSEYWATGFMEYAKYYQINEDEYYLNGSSLVTQSANGTWCYSFIVVCNQPSHPLNKEAVPVVAKVIQLQECQLVKTE